MLHPFRRPANSDALLTAVALAGIVAGGALHLGGQPTAGDVAWAAVLVLVLVPLTVDVVRSLLHGDVGVDLVALLAMAGALALGQYLAGAVIAVMMSGGNALEAVAARRARRELTALVERTPRTAHLHRDGGVEDVPVEAVRPGDVLSVKPGEILPVDGVVEAGDSVLDTSAVSGEAIPVAAHAGTRVRSGSVNVGDPFDMHATHSAADSTYAGIVRLVREAQAERAPLVRLADRYAVILLPVTVGVAGLAWALSGNPVRALAVLVVATPCPLILATPIAIISGVSRAARLGVIVKGGGAMEALGDARRVLLDKTGTLTVGTPELVETTTLDSVAPDELLRLAASLDQLSTHVLADALAAEAERRGLGLTFPESVNESAGEGVRGRVGDRSVALGRLRWLAAQGIEVTDDAERVKRHLSDTGQINVFVAVDGAVAGVLVMADRLRDDSPAMVEALRSAGVERVVMVTGDRQDVAERVAERAGIGEVIAECLPDQKLAVVRRMQAEHDGPVVMVGDGVNDAPALALADVGVAMGARGSTVSSQSADVVLLVDRVDRVADAIRLGRRAIRIAREGILWGMGLSFAAMGFAAFGFIPPVAGAILQEVIDVGVILNALRVLRAP